MKYCVSCDQMVKPVKKFNWAWFLLFCLTGIGGIFYLMYYFLLKGKQCPMCYGASFRSKKPQ
jgi:hypothetical protein